MRYCTQYAYSYEYDSRTLLVVQPGGEVQHHSYRYIISNMSFEFDMLFIPIHLNGHWNLVVVDLRGGRECFALYDSLYSRETSTNKTILDNIQRYIGDEASAKAGMQLPVSSWPRHYRENIPKQKNGYDCGVFMMRFAEYLSRDHVLAFGQHDIAHFRHRAVVEILRMKV